MMLMLHLLLILFAGGALAWWSESRSPNAPRWVALATLTVATIYLLGGAVAILAEQYSLAPRPDSPQTWLLHYSAEWIPRFGISFELAMDGLSLILIVLTLLLGMVAVISSWSEIDQRRGFFQANLLWTLTGVIGVFLALDLFLFFLFWEVMLVPMYLLIAIWGHEQRAYASMKFFIFTQFSGLLLLFSILVLVHINQSTTGQYSFSYFDLLGTQIEPEVALWVMLGFFIAFAVKLPAFPFHTWLPDAHTQAPTAGSVILAGILLKTGAYGLLRFAIPLFPEAAMEFAPVAMAMGAVAVVYGALLAFGQSDFKRLVAYSSVSHMGFVLLGLYAWNTLAVQGAVIQMVAHGVSTAALFMTAGALQQRLHTRDMNRMGGLWQNMPRMGACAMFFALASLGLPGLGNFVAEFLVLLGVFQVSPLFALIAVLGLITGAVYSLSMMQRAFQGEPDERREWEDYGGREMAAMIAMMVALVWLGLYPQPVLDLAQPVLDSLHVGALVSKTP
jgi:NADH-quinone oxidoreductase subunit M